MCTPTAERTWRQATRATPADSAERGSWRAIRGVLKAVGGRDAEAPREALSRRHANFYQGLLAAPATVLVVGLIAFHAQILWQRLASMTLLQPDVALRWALSVAVLAGLFQLRRAGVSLLKGRKAIVFWLAVLLIHVSLPIPGGEQPADDVVPSQGAALFFILPATATLTLVVGAALALQAVSAGAGAGSRVGRYRCRSRPIGGPSLTESYPHLFSRPPPA